MEVRYNLVIDFARPNKSNTIIISEGDERSRLIHFTLLADKKPFDMSDVTSAEIKGIKADGSVIWGSATILKDIHGSNLNELEYLLPGNLSDIANKVTVQVQLQSNTGAIISSFEYYIEVRNALYSEDDYISEEDLQGFRDLLNRCLAALSKIEAMTEAEALPCPYPINITIEDETYGYNGAEQVDVAIKDVTYIADDPNIATDAVDESAARIVLDAFRSFENSYDTLIGKLNNMEAAIRRLGGTV